MESENRIAGIVSLEKSLEIAKEAERSDPCMENCDEVAFVDALLSLSRTGLCSCSFEELDIMSRRRPAFDS